MSESQRIAVTIIEIILASIELIFMATYTFVILPPIYWEVSSVLLVLVMVGEIITDAIISRINRKKKERE